MVFFFGWVLIELLAGFDCGCRERKKWRGKKSEVKRKRDGEEER